MRECFCLLFFWIIFVEEKLPIFYFFPLSLSLEPRKEKTDSSNGNNPLSPQEQQQQQLQQHQQQQQQHYQQHMHMMMSSGGDSHHQSVMKPERPNSFGPKITKRINFYHENNCKSQLPATWKYDN